MNRRELKSGLGRVVGERDHVTLHYLAAPSDHALDAGQPVESSYDHDKPVCCALGDHMLLLDLERAIVGMQVGSTWRVTVPAAMAFGESGLPERLPPHSDLALEVFIQAAAPTGSTTFQELFAREAISVKLRAPEEAQAARLDLQEQVITPEAEADAQTELARALLTIDQNIVQRQGKALATLPEVEAKRLRWIGLKREHTRLQSAFEAAVRSRDGVAFLKVGAAIATLLEEVSRPEA